MSAVANWREEKQSAWLYRIVAETERDVGKRSLFASLADAAESQARIWARHIEKSGERLPPFRPNLRARVVALLLSAFGPRALRPVLAAMKIRGISVYRAPALVDHPMPTSVEDVGRGHRGVGQGGNLRAAVFGVNDGLVSNTSLIMGVAGASSSGEIVLLTGIAGLLAGAFSMAAGEYVSMRSQREMYEYQIGLEREELQEYPDEEAEELALIYHARGLEMGQARSLADALLRDPKQALDVLAREELGLDPDDLGSPVGAAVSSFSAFAAGAFIPLLPFLLTTGRPALIGAALLAGAALFVVGAILSLFTGRKAGWGGARMLLIGGGAGLATYLLGMLLGVQLA